jgi:ADP-ribose pyrophosphatase YjhB (NUDIX family)
MTGQKSKFSVKIMRETERECKRKRGKSRERLEGIRDNEKQTHIHIYISYHVAELTAEGEQEDLVNQDKKLLLDQL